MADPGRDVPDMMERWTRLVLRWRVAVIAAWLLALACGITAALDLPRHLTNRFTVPNSEHDTTEQLLQRHFGQRSDGTLVIVLRRDRPDRSDQLLHDASHVGLRAAGEVRTARLRDVARLDERTVIAVVSSELEPAEVRERVDAVRASVRQPGNRDELRDTEVWVTGSGAIARDIEPVNQADLARGELYFGLPMATLIVLLVFGTLAVLLPLAFALAVIPVTLGIVWVFAQQMELSIYVTNMTVGIGLGVTIDYSLLMHARYREERRRHERDEAIVRTMATAGRAVIFSGTAVAIGLALLLLMPLPFLRGFGVAGLMIPLVAMLCAMTLLPVLLQLTGDLLDAVPLLPRRWLARRERPEDQSFWSRLAHAIMRRPVWFAGLSTALLLAMAAPMLDLRLTPGSEAGFPPHLESIQGLDAIKETVGEGAMAPVEVIVDTGEAGGARRPDVQAATRRLIAAAGRDPEVAGVNFGPLDDERFVDDTGRYLHLQILNRHEYGLPSSMRLVRRLREDVVPAARLPEGVTAYIGGAAPSGVDFLDIAYGAFPWLVAAVLACSYILLLRAFRSLLLPLKAIVLNLLSIGAAYGLTVLAFVHGAGEWAGLQQVGQVEGWVPIFMFAMLFGLSMDYEVFLVSRMREEWDAGAGNEAAVARGLARTGRLVTAAGMIMVVAFGGFLSASFVSLQQFGFGLATAVLIDVTVVRMMLLPAAMRLFGRWNWWLPIGVARVVRVQPSPLVRPSSAVPSAAPVR